MLYNDKQAQQHYKENCLKLEQLFKVEHINPVLKERFAPHFRGEVIDSYDDWEELGMHYPDYQFSLIPFMVANDRVYKKLTTSHRQEKLRSYQVLALKQYGNTLVNKKANTELLLAHCRALGYKEPKLKDSICFKGVEDTHYILETREDFK